MDDVLEISCDEAGSTGPALLDPAQPLFAFASVAISDADCDTIIKSGLMKYPVQMPELKASKLLRSSRGRTLLHHLIEAANGRFAVSVHEKQYALCCQFFEYTFEPVFKDSPWLLYRKNLHRFVAMTIWAWLKGKEPEAKESTAQFQAYMRTLDPRQAPLLFGAAEESRIDALPNDPFASILRFVRAHRAAIVCDNATLRSNLPANARWILDLSTTSLWSHLNHWGRKDSTLRIFCDVSKPLASSIPNFTGDEHDPGIKRWRAKGNLEPLGWKCVAPPAFVDSKEHPAIQLADIIAGGCIHAIDHDSDCDPSLRELILKHVLPHSIVPHFASIDPQTREAAVNAAIVYRMAERAEQGLNSYESLALDYQFAEAGWDSGAFRPPM